MENKYDYTNIADLVQCILVEGFDYLEGINIDIKNKVVNFSFGKLNKADHFSSDFQFESYEKMKHFLLTFTTTPILRKELIDEMEDGLHSKPTLHIIHFIFYLIIDVSLLIIINVPWFVDILLSMGVFVSTKKLFYKIISVAKYHFGKNGKQKLNLILKNIDQVVKEIDLEIEKEKQASCEIVNEASIVAESSPTFYHVVGEMDVEKKRDFKL